jgi:5-(carboxyamino)imidazole ribonucleotide synthase
MTSPILPGATLGVLGSGQLGRMFAIAARRLGYRVECYSPDRETPAGQVCDREWTAEYDDFNALAEFARGVEVVTLEFENISVEAVNAIERSTPVRPAGRALSVSQHRTREKTTLRSLGLPTAPFAIIHSAEDLQAAISSPEINGEGILKTAAWGYDGKGQRRITKKDDLGNVWGSFQAEEAVLEGVVDFDCEVSVIGVRGLKGEFQSYGPILNHHRHHILDVSIAPVNSIPAALSQEAIAIARTIMESLDAVGVLCVEFFVTRNGQLVVNEIAPRPHNSGHLTIDAHVCCQFEQQARAVCGLPLGSTRQRCPAAMANLLGDVWETPEGPRWNDLLAMPDVKLHLYGKAEARAGRKMGHLTALADDVAAAETLSRAGRDVLRGGKTPG